MKHKYYLEACHGCGQLRRRRIDSSNVCFKCSRAAVRTHGEFGTPLYDVYQGMLARCGHKKNVYPQKHNYEFKGIKVCDEWLLDRKIFFVWARKNGYQQGLLIDRIDNDKGYAPDNCRWVTPADSAQNRSTTKLSFQKVAEIRWAVSKGETQTSVARRYGINSGSISEIINRKMWVNVPEWLG